MKKFRKLALTLIATLICVFSAVIFTGCDDEDTCKLYVFASVGGCVQVDDNEEMVRFGDEGSKYFTYKEDTKVKLKAIADKGYQFVKWMYTDDLNQEYNIDPNKAEIEFVIDDDKVVVRAQFAIDGSITYNVVYPTSTTGYDITIESGYTTNVVLGGDFKFKVDLWQDYSNSNIVVKANGSVITPNSNKVYTIPKINADVNITVTGVEKNETEVTPTTFTITTDDNRFTIVPISTNICQVNPGDSFVFQIEMEDGWRIADNGVVKANGITLSNPIDNNYKIYSINEDIVITIEGIEEYIAPQTYNITISGEGFTVVPQNGETFQVVSGESFAFKIQLDTGYQFGDKVAVKANGIELQAPVNDVYTIYSVIDDMEITVEGIEEIPPTMYTISVVGRGFTIVPQNGALFEVEEGNSFAFTIELDEGYVFGSNVVVKANSQPLTNDQEVYTIDAVVEDVEITVEGVEIEKLSYVFTVNFKDSALANMVEDIWLTIPHTISFEIEYNASNLEGESALAFEFNKDVNSLTVEQLFNNINEFIENNSLLNRSKVSHLEINGKMFIGEINGVMTIDWSAIDSMRTVDIVLI